jgi:hypothetical protein
MAAVTAGVQATLSATMDHSLSGKPPISTRFLSEPEDHLHHLGWMARIDDEWMTTCDDSPGGIANRCALVSLASQMRIISMCLPFFPAANESKMTAEMVR